MDCSIKTLKGEQLRIAPDCKQLWTTASKISKESKVKGLQQVKICEQWKDCIIKYKIWPELHALHVKYWLYAIIIIKSSKILYDRVQYILNQYCTTKYNIFSNQHYTSSALYFQINTIRSSVVHFQINTVRPSTVHF